MKKLTLIFVVLTLAFQAVSAQDLKMFKLPNGLTVFIWEDTSQPDVYGEVVVRTGSVNDPSEYTGLAHYLEHVMFKGTRKIGALDWEREKPLYGQIIERYDQLAETTDPTVRTRLVKEINDLSVEAGKISVTGEYSNLIESIGGSGLNAGTSYDMTYFHNFFPPNQLAKWLALSSERFIDPVFRTFQAELETVYEEYNRYSDNADSRLGNQMLQKAFDGSPYGRDIIGLGEHLKNPRLSKLIEFYDTWYVPENMALILVGNVNAKIAQRLVVGTYGRLHPKACPARPDASAVPVKGRVQCTTKISRYPSTTLFFNGAKSSSEDEIALTVCAEILSNSAMTGIIDKLVIDGKVMSAACEPISFVQSGRMLVNAIPSYSQETNAYDSNKNVEKMLLAAVGKLKSGDFSQELLSSIKVNLGRDYELTMEDSRTKASVLREAFVSGEDIASALAFKDKLNAITAEDVKRVAAKYFTGDYLVFFNELGKFGTGEKITKPDIKPIDPPVGVSSEYAKWFKGMAAPQIEEKYLDFSKVREKQVNSYSRLYYVKNSANDIFTLTLKYGAPSAKFPYLRYAARLMQTAGIMAQYTPQALKEEFGRLGITCNISADDNWLNFTLRGYDEYLEDACKLLTKLVLMPAVDEKQMQGIIGSAVSDRLVRKKGVEREGEALREYIIYGPESRYMKELTDRQLIEMDIDKLVGEISRATHCQAEIHYSGLKEFDDAYRILSTSLPLVEGETKSESPVVRKLADYSENEVFFIADPEARQAQIYFYVPMGNWDRKYAVLIDAYNRYMSGGLDGVVMNEIREKNSMAYTASGRINSQKLPGSRMYYEGYIGTQNDKAVDAVGLLVKLVKKMPVDQGAIDNLRNYLVQTSFTNVPSDRMLSLNIASWRRQGYMDDPAREKVPAIKNLAFDDIVRFASGNLEGRPIVIGIVGNPKLISVKDLETFGKVNRLKIDALFNQEDKMF